MTEKSRIFIGTSGWNYNHWRKHFYPEKLPVRSWLEYYTENFDTVEINNSFYQLPKENAIKNWMETTPGNFTFAVKASRYITHMKKLKEPEDAFSKFFDRIKMLGKKLGPALFQLPPRWHADPDRLAAFMKLIPKKLRVAFEFRDDTWWKDNILDILKKHNAAFCIYELDGVNSPVEITADFIYLRMHGPKGSYEGSYDDSELAEWADKIKKWSRKGLDVYCYFDNDEKAYAAKNALTLKRMLE